MYIALFFHFVDVYGMPKHPEVPILSACTTNGSYVFCMNAVSSNLHLQNAIIRPYNMVFIFPSIVHFGSVLSLWEAGQDDLMVKNFDC